MAATPKKFDIKLARDFLQTLADDWESGIKDGTYEKDLKRQLAKLQALIEAPSAIIIPKADRTYMQCSSCGGFDVRKDAWAEWNPKKGAWELATTFDACHCETCEGESTLDEIDAKAFADLRQLDQDERSESNGLAMMEGRLDDIR